MKDAYLCIIAIMSVLLVAILFAMVLACAGYFFVLVPLVEHHRRQEIIRREPWRELLPNNGF